MITNAQYQQMCLCKAMLIEAQLQTHHKFVQFFSFLFFKSGRIMLTMEKNIDFHSRFNKWRVALFQPKAAETFHSRLPFNIYSTHLTINTV